MPEFICCELGFILLDLDGRVRLVASGVGAGLGSIARDVGAAGIDFAQTIERLTAEIVGADEFVVFGESGEGGRVVGIGEENLLPELDGHVRPATRLKRSGLFSETGASGVGGTGDGVFLSEGYRESEQKATRCE